MRFRGIIIGFAIISLAACATVPGVDAPPTEPAADTTGVIVAEPEASPKSAPAVTSPVPAAPEPPKDAPPPVADIRVYESPLTDLAHWRAADHRPALSSFRRSCQRWEKTENNKPLNSYLPEYGTYGDWSGACELAMLVGDSSKDARVFFENQFAPVPLSAQNGERGLLTGYYQPELEVRRVPTPEFSEPILAVPTKDRFKTLPRSKITPRTSRVIAYGRPLEVFFMQIQGSGHIRFEDGRKIRAAYAGNNGFDYTSIGGVLIRRGDTTKDRSAKRDIEAWMRKAGPKAARDLMNENKRYIFFTEQKIEEGEGPMGGMRVPLTDMGSMAVDPRYHPYGALIWLQVKIPQEAGDYRGTEQGLLLSAQDTGKAIVGALRGDIYFGSGDAAGAKAGVMKHNGQWTLLLPRALAERLLAQQRQS
ncbi:murein transglycosylase A [Fretibacter rubidus]|uniref:murein transglycosylase A n=1 Tax=Fretibacter rubidus TaxID=570162 RepID=UPI00352AC6E5